MKINEIEKLKKEVWYLGHVKIPQLQELIENSSTGDLSSIVNDVNECKDDIDSLESSLSSMNTNISSINTSVSSINTSIDQQGTSISNLQNSVETLNTSVSTISSNFQEDIDNVETQITSLNSTTSSHATTLSSLSSQISTLSNSISSLSSQLTELENTVDSMEPGSGSGSTITVVYDKESDDATINLGYTDGILIGTSLVLDLSSYSSIRVYASFNNFDLQAEFKLDNREGTDFNAYTCATNFATYYFSKFYVNATRTRFTTNYVAELVFNNDGSVTKTLIRNDADFYIYRIECLS